MTNPRRRSPTINYTIHKVSFSVVRETVTAPRLRLSQPNDVKDFLRAHGIIPDDAKEHFVILLLNLQNELLATHHVSTGTLSASLVHPRDVFGPALRMLGVGSIILAHNHPSGDATPSQEDIRLTKQLIKCSKLLDVSIHDHIIIGNGTESFTSFAQKGLL